MRIWPWSNGRNGIDEPPRFEIPPNGRRPGPAVTQQPTISGEYGQPLQVVISELVLSESDGVSMFHGLRSFLRAEQTQDQTTVDLALSRLISDLQRKAEKLGADAVVNVSVSSTRGVGAGGQRRLRISATGTAIRFEEKETGE